MKIKMRVAAVILSFLLCGGLASALEPDEILIIANSDVPASTGIARYYCKRRNVPTDNILALPLGESLSDTIDREDYENRLAEHIRENLSKRGLPGEIRCLLTTYGVPVKVGKRKPLKDQEDKVKQLRKLLEQEKAKLKQLEESSPRGSGESVAEQRKSFNVRITRLQSRIDLAVGKETNASVDSELSMVLAENYELYRWQPNMLNKSVPQVLSFNTLMVCRIDGPDETTARGLIDKAIAVEKTGLKGIAYIDSRGMADDKNRYSTGHFDQSLRDLAALTRVRAIMAVKHEDTEKLFALGSCPQAAIYCGWYSLRKYIDAFDFVDGAIGYHISSLEAVDLRDPDSTQWCPSMLKDGITATLGAVAEPYLHSFPEPKAFFSELFTGYPLVEAFYRTKPFNSWQLVLIGDPLYKPFRNR
jgi:uncharacterized protein (TIGR03790 family)